MGVLPRGFSLIETLFALAIFVAGAGMLAGLLLLGDQTVRRSRAATASAMFAQQKIEQLRGAPPEDSPPGALNENLTGYWDLVEGHYLRRWSVRTVDAAIGAAVIQVWVTPSGAQTGGALPSEGALLETIVERALP
jgi:prepilin-type N-terminal cleavage/methylation domain-containing protein